MEVRAVGKNALTTGLLLTDSGGNSGDDYTCPAQIHFQGLFQISFLSGIASSMNTN